MSSSRFFFAKWTKFPFKPVTLTRSESRFRPDLEHGEVIVVRFCVSGGRDGREGARLHRDARIKLREWLQLSALVISAWPHSSANTGTLTEEFTELAHTHTHAAPLHSTELSLLSRRIHVIFLPQNYIFLVMQELGNRRGPLPLAPTLVRLLRSARQVLL